MISSREPTGGSVFQFGPDDRMYVHGHEVILKPTDSMRTALIIRCAEALAQYDIDWWQQNAPSAPYRVPASEWIGYRRKAECVLIAAGLIDKQQEPM